VYRKFIQKKVFQLKIHQKRKEMIDIGSKYGLNHQQTLTCSQQLDQLLNEYNRLLCQEIVRREEIEKEKSKVLSIF
jgi:stage 0 sporulation regulatory protein